MNSWNRSLETILRRTLTIQSKEYQFIKYLLQNISKEGFKWENGMVYEGILEYLQPVLP